MNLVEKTVRFIKQYPKVSYLEMAESESVISCSVFPLFRPFWGQWQKKVTFGLTYCILPGISGNFFSRVKNSHRVPLQQQSFT